MKKLMNIKRTLTCEIDKEVLKQGMNVWYVCYETIMVNERNYRVVPQSPHTMLQASFFPEINIEINDNKKPYELTIECKLLKKAQKGLIGLGVFAVILGLIAIIGMWKGENLQIQLAFIFPCFYLIQILIVTVVFRMFSWFCIKK